MGREFRHRLSIHGELLFTRFTQNTGGRQAIPPPLPMPVDPKSLTSKTYGTIVRMTEITPGEPQVMYRVEQVGLAPAVRAANGCDRLVEHQWRLWTVPELKSA